MSKMPLNRYIKIPSTQSGKFNTTTLNRIDFDFDPNLVYDFDNSWIELNMNVVASESTSSKTGTYKIKSVFPNHTGVKLENSMMVKNCHLRSSNNGMLEDIRDVNILRYNLKKLMDSSADEDGRAFKEVGHLFENNKLKSSIFRELHKEGNVKSRDVQAPVRIKMSELFNLGSLSEFDCRKLGRVRAHIELDNIISFVPQTVADMGGSQTMDDITGANANVNTFTQVNIPVLEQSKFWVNQVVKIDATGNGGAGNIVDHYAVITTITYNQDRSVSIIVDSPITALTAGQSYTAVTMTPVEADAAATSFTIDFAELVTQVVSQPSAMAELNYTTYTTEQYNANGLTNFQRLYQVEPEAISLMALFPKSNNGVASSNTDINNYRLKIDNIDQTDRNVVPHSPLYYNILNETMLDAGLPVANLNEYALSCNSVTNDKRTSGEKLIYISAALDATQREKNIQININASGSGVGLINLYKLVSRKV